MKKNTSGLWDSLWARESSFAESISSIRKEELSIRWQIIHSEVLKKFGSFDRLQVVEVGAGSGTYAALMAKKGASVTIIDYSAKALARSKKLFSHCDLNAVFIQADALRLPSALQSCFDVSMSFGLAEHFLDNERVAIIRAHFDLLRPNGLTLISVPNKWNFPYRVYKFVCEITNRWEVGEEYPFSRSELSRIMKRLNIREYKYFGDSFYSSFRYLLSLPGVRKLLKSRPAAFLDSYKLEKGTLLDPYCSYALVLCALKNS